MNVVVMPNKFAGLGQLIAQGLSKKGEEDDYQKAVQYASKLIANNPELAAAFGGGDKKAAPPLPPNTSRATPPVPGDSQIVQSTNPSQPEAVQPGMRNGIDFSRPQTPIAPPVPSVTPTDKPAVPAPDATPPATPAAPVTPTSAAGEQPSKPSLQAPSFAKINQKYQSVFYKNLADIGSGSVAKIVAPMLADYYGQLRDSEYSQIKNDYLSKVFEGFKSGQFDDRDALILATQLKNIGFQINENAFMEAFKDPSSLQVNNNGKETTYYSFNPRTKQMNPIMTSPNYMNPYQEASIGLQRDEYNAKLNGGMYTKSSGSGSPTPSSSTGYMELDPKKRKTHLENYQAKLQGLADAPPAQRAIYFQMYGNDIIDSGIKGGVNPKIVRDQILSAQHGGGIVQGKWGNDGSFAPDNTNYGAMANRPANVGNSQEEVPYPELKKAFGNWK